MYSNTAILIFDNRNITADILTLPHLFQHYLKQLSYTFPTVDEL